MSSAPKSQPLKPRFSAKLLILSFLLLVVGGGLLFGCQHTSKISWFGSSKLPSDVVTVFFSKYQGDHSIVENVVRKLPKEAKSEPLRFAVTELLKGPTSEEKGQGFYSEIPQGTQLLGLKTEPQTVTINLSKQFATGGGSNSMTQRLEQLKQTVFSNDSEHALKLSVEGKPLELLGGEGLEVQDELNRAPQ